MILEYKNSQTLYILHSTSKYMIKNRNICYSLPRAGYTPKSLTR